MSVRILSADPGVMTGYCYAQINDEGRLRYAPFQVVDDVDELWRRLDRFRPNVLIYEDFAFRQGKQRTGVNLFPLQLIGVMRLYTMFPDVHCQVYCQTPAFGKQYYTNNVLKQLGLFKPGAAWEHAMDASRHLLQWTTFGAGNKYITSKTRDFAKLVEMSHFQ